MLAGPLPSAIVGVLKEHPMTNFPENKEPPKPDNDIDTRGKRTEADEAREIEEKGEPEGGGNFA